MPRQLTPLLRRACALLLVPAALGAVAGCGSSSAGDDADASAIAFDRNQRVHLLPLDQFRTIDDGLVNYADNLLVRGCMEEAGFAWPIPTYDPNLKPSVTWNATGRRIFDPQIASQYGYHIAPSNDPHAAEALALNSRQLSPDEERARNRCMRKAYRQLPPPDLDLVDSLAGAAYVTAKADDATVEATRRWAECMAPQGVSDLPDAPTRMPSPSLARRFRLDSASSSATPAEIRLAVADARCRESSGYARQLYDAEVDEQLALFARNDDALARIRAQVERSVREARAVVSRFGAQ